MAVFDSDRLKELIENMGYRRGEIIQHRMISKAINRAQKKIEDNAHSDNQAKSSAEWFKINTRIDL